MSRFGTPSLSLNSYSSSSDEEDEVTSSSGRDEETATCLWGECGTVFTQLASLIEHIHTEHVGVNKSAYACDWSTCPRRGIPQTSRFALTSHLRSHTKEKPFVCPLPECDKSFTRSDALAKHLRHQHNKSPPAPGRGGSRKRKRMPGDIEVTAVPSTRSLTPTLTTFAFPNDPADNPNDPAPPPRPPPPPPPPNPEGELMDFTSPAVDNASRSPSPPIPPPHLLHSRSHSHGYYDGHHSQYEHEHEYEYEAQYDRAHSPFDDQYPYSDARGDAAYRGGDAGNGNGNGRIDGGMDPLPPSLRALVDPATLRIHGRSQTQVMYLLVKAKHRHALTQHALLLARLADARAELEAERARKEGVLDRVVRGVWGPAADPFVAPVPVPASMSSSSSMPPSASTSVPPSASSVRPSSGGGLGGGGGSK